MALAKTGPGDDVDAWCTKCKMTLSHRVIATVGSTIQRVKCLTCNGEHKYHPPKTEKVKAPAKKPTRAAVEKAKKAAMAKPSPEKSLGEWTTFMRDYPEDGAPRTYRVTENFHLGEFVEHPVFGAGKVTDIVGAGKIEVAFKEGRKVLIFNRKPLQ